MKLDFRNAVRSECGQIAVLDSIASDGVVDYLFHGLVPGKTPVEVVAYCLEEEKSPFSYRNCVVAVDGDKVVGMAISYPSEYFTVSQDMVDFFPAERLEHFSDFFAARVDDSLYLDALCVLPEYQRKGIASEFMDMLIAKADKLGFTSISVIAFVENRPAMDFYAAHGFEEVRPVRLKPADHIKHTKGGSLMVKDISGR